MREQNLKEATEEILKNLNPRTREVIEKRFGLRSISRNTLEAIGQNLRVTRERVRQIEALGLKQLSHKNALELLRPAFAVAEKHLADYGGVRKEDILLKELAGLFCLKEKNSDNLINFLLALGEEKFQYFKETPKWRASWALSNASYKEAINLVNALEKIIIEKKFPISRDVLLKNALSLNNGMNDKILDSHIELCRSISQNPFGEWGAISSPEISPRGVKDKAYLIFKKEKKPLHFTQVASLINQVGFWDRKAHSQTVHNELIKDSRFVLIGRGTYALADWGYEPGTVRDVLVSALKNAKMGMTKNELIETIKAKRLVKENTILLNLQNKKFFKKENERFTLQ